MNLKKKLQKRCVLMGVFFGITYSAVMTLTMRYGEDLASGLLYFAIMAITGGLLYGFLMYPVLRRQQKEMLKRFPALAEKSIIAEQAAFRVSAEKPKAVSGWSYLTAEALYFSAEGKKYGDHSLEIPFDRINALQIGTVNNNDCVKLSLTGGSTVCLRFGNNSADWAVKINEAMKHSKANSEQ